MCGKWHPWLGGIQGLSQAGSDGCSALASAGDQKTVAQVAPYRRRLWPTACTCIRTASVEGGPTMQGHHPRGLARQAGRRLDTARGERTSQVIKRLPMSLGNPNSMKRDELHWLIGHE